MTDLTWRSSTYSSGGSGNCLEVADGGRGVVPVRDSKRTDGPMLVVATDAWRAFVHFAKRA
ncbi:DUF397 domain-containing protein [Streptomyces sp. PT12]|uniref:DUF397 domain-containing protein n=1 Tax=Streptomyces sp. PT12 TaxID=1510197 RepID=UPI000DE37B1A|nr:DUF397 domain-containing protein [Streptomyces sp. PT12]RBM20719.1 DUF397 domain-containing protein [Streptomyces sp. PT12]